MNETIAKGGEIIGKVQSGGLLNITFVDFIWIVGAIVLAILALKVVGKLFKVILFVVAVALIIGFLLTSGILPF